MLYSVFPMSKSNYAPEVKNNLYKYKDNLRYPEKSIRNFEIL
jgi:hypothetical protein